jgi:hypothetical protein
MTQAVIVQPRDPTGRFVYTLESSQRDAQAATLRAKRMSYRQIAVELGYASPGHAYQGVSRALAAAPRESVEEAPLLVLDMLDTLYREVLAIMERPHPIVQRGHVVMIEHPETGQQSPIPDPYPALKAVDTLLKVIHAQAKLLGLYNTKEINVWDSSELDEVVRQLEQEIVARGGTIPDCRCRARRRDPEFASRARGAVCPPDVRLVRPATRTGRTAIAI